MSECKKCREAGRDAQVFPGFTSRTSDTYVSVFVDDGGCLHYHDPNPAETFFCCDAGHEWRESTVEPCPVCGDGWQESGGG